MFDAKKSSRAQCGQILFVKDNHGSKVYFPPDGIITLSNGGQSRRLGVQNIIDYLIREHPKELREFLLNPALDILDRI